MKIGILYIGIGRYICFWKDFYDSCEKFLIPEAEKHYYVFTDNESFIKSSERISIFHQDDMGWPCNSLLRFKMFRRIKDLLKDNDYLFFFNSNAKIVLPVSTYDILPEGEEEYSAMCIDDNPYSSGFEQRQISACYVKVGETPYYFSGALNGGKTDSYIHLIETCDDIVDTELRNGIMPKWHDESVLNRYLIGKRTKPANWREPKNAKIILRRKEDVLGRNWLRNYKGREHTNTWLRKFLRKIGLIK